MAGPSRIPYDDQLSFSHSFDDSESILYHHVEDVAPVLHYTGNDYSGISAWAAAVPFGAVVPEQSRPPSRQSRASSRRSSISHRSPMTATMRPPELLKPHAPLPPTLCITTTSKSIPSRPILARPSPACESRASYACSASTGRTTDSSVATPASAKAMPFADRGVLETIASQVFSWVSPSPIHGSIDATPVRFPSTVTKPRPSQKLLERTHLDLSRSRPSPRVLVA